ncbi:MAG TPA: glycosyltransferase family 4 protein [Chitinophagales bacterium]|nr:glycosyltransferase family 4 protein [Chitinophagales bacterium]
MKVLFLVPYPVGEAPSQRFRFEQYFELMRKKGIHFDVSPFLDKEAWNILYDPGKFIAKFFGIVRGFFRRVKDVLRSRSYDYVFIHREAAPLGPPLFEWLLAKVFTRKIIYDFDDAIWLPNVSESNRFFSKIKWYHKVSSICRWSYLISCGNGYLREYALLFNQNVVVNPTVVDTDNHYNQLKEHRRGKTVIGWTGTHTTVRYLDDVLPVLKKLEEESDVEIRIISNAPPSLPLTKLKFIPWNKASEIDDLLSFDIGIMPLPDEEWTRGKCGFKLIQYLSLGIPAVASPVGINPEILDDGINGYLCVTHDQWLKALRELLEHPEKRQRFGENGREKIIAHFSAGANAPLFLRIFA